MLTLSIVLLLFILYNIEMVNKQTCKMKKNIIITEGKDKSSKVPAPSVVLESLRLTLADYRKRLDNTSEEVRSISCQSLLY